MNLADLSQNLHFQTIDDMLDHEISDIRDIRYKTQKKTLAKKLNNIYNGFFLDKYNRKTYGNFLSRALTSYVLSRMFNIPDEEAATYITDDVKDFGIDAIYSFNNKIYVFQTKFNKTVNREDICEIKEGIKRLLSLEDNLDEFNEHIKSRVDEIRKILLIDELKIVPIFIFLGQQISPNIINFFENEIKDNIEYGDFIETYNIIGSEKIFDYEIQTENISDVFTLDKFFERHSPTDMYSGCIKVSFLKILYQKYKDALFSKNIRLFIEDSPINRGIQETLINEPENFLYYNNGITFICDEIKKLAISAASQNIKTIKVENMSIVNGAQTVLSCATIDNISDEALVQIRIIKTSNVSKKDDNFALTITKFNNSQNAVSPMDLRTLDPIHNEIKKFFIKNGQYYLYKTGENKNQENYITFEDLMIALGCYYEQSQIVKQNKGELWANTKLYHDLLKTRDLQLYLLLCLIKKQVDIDLQKYIETNNFLVHWNRLILELIYKKLDIQRHYDFEIIKYRIDPLIKEITDGIIQYIEQNNKSYNIFHRQAKSYQKIKDYIIDGTVNIDNEPQMFFDFIS